MKQITHSPLRFLLILPFLFLSCEDYNTKKENSDQFLDILTLSPAAKTSLNLDPNITAQLVFDVKWDDPDYTDAKLNYFDFFEARLSIKDVDGSWFTLERYNQSISAIRTGSIDFNADLAWFFENEDVYWQPPYTFRFSLLVAPGVVLMTDEVVYY